MNDNAGAWVISKVWSKTGIPIDVKASGPDTASAIDDLYKGIKHGIENFGWLLEQPGAPKMQTTDKAPASTPAPTGPAQPANVDTSVNTMEIKKVKVEPQPDGKIKVAMFAEGHKYADLYMTQNLDRTLEALNGTGYEWTAEYLSKTAEYDMAFFADWRNSEKLNSKGNPYKNVIALRPLTASA